MSAKDEEFLKKLVATFRIEADEHVKAMFSGLIELEKSQSERERSEIIERVYREAHSLKGGARAVNMKAVEAVCQALEGLLSALKAGKIGLSTSMLDVLHQAAGTVERLLSNAEGVEITGIIQELGRLKQSGPRPPIASITEAGDVSDTPPPPSPTEVLSRAPAVEHGESSPPADTPTFSPEPPAQSRGTNAVTETFALAERALQTETVRISVKKLDPLLFRSEEMLAVKLTTTQRAADTWNIVSDLTEWRQRWTRLSSNLRGVPAAGANESGGNGQGMSGADAEEVLKFLDWNHTYLRTMEDRLRALAKSADSDSRHLGAMVDELLEGVKEVLMLPVSTLLEVFPKLVRDLSRELRKEVNLVIQGGDLEIDRRILEEMKDPLIHLVRNCIDHGIESPQERQRKGKPPRGSVRITASRIGSNQAEIVVSDDGAGIDVEKVRLVATSRGLVAPSEASTLTEDDSISLAFRSGLSTSPIVTDISGHGLGLAIVRENVEKIGGRVTVRNAPGNGASFVLSLPATLATFRGILVTASDQMFVVPTNTVERVVRIHKDTVGTVENRDTIQFDGRTISLVRLSDVLQLPRTSRKIEVSDYLHVMVLRSGERRVGFVVGDVLQEQEVLVKGLGRQLVRIRNLAGATALGSGRLVPILNVNDLIRSAAGMSFDLRGPLEPTEELQRQMRSILVAEDSITSRMLLKNILESAGYQVKVTVDGGEAWRELKTGHYDLVVSDVEMPRMTGFDLTAKIRADEDLGHTPVVLVTALGSREDRERGIDVGANAYIVKSSFDQSNLLEVVERLI